MLRFFLCSFLVIIAHISFGQLTKGHWLVGGSGRFYTYKEDLTTSLGTSNGKYTQIAISPNIGYFFADKFALGMKTTITSLKGDWTGGSGTSFQNTQRYLLGVFSRYYILEAEKQTNILVDASFQTGIVRQITDVKGTLNNFSISAGPVIYFNSSVGIEFLVGYVTDTEKLSNRLLTETRSGFQVSIGLQIHLIK